MSEERIYNIIDDCGRDQIPLDLPTITLEGGDEISAGLRHHHQYGAVLSEEAEGPRAHSMQRHVVEAMSVVQGVIVFMKI